MKKSSTQQCSKTNTARDQIFWNICIFSRCLQIYTEKLPREKNYVSSFC